MTSPPGPLRITPTSDLDACFAIRRRVFIEEQQVPEPRERDEYDATAVHLLATRAGHPIGTARLVIDGDTAKIGRVAVLADERGTGLGAQLMHAALDELRSRGVRTATLGSQTYAIGFYEKLGFVAHGPEYDDAGIAHRDMTIEL